MQEIVGIAVAPLPVDDVVALVSAMKSSISSGGSADGVHGMAASPIL
jgi:hypothetical protein